MNITAATDHDIVRRVLSGDRDAYALLVRAHQGKVLSLCLSLLRNPSQAEDAAQDIFLKAYKSLSSFRLDAAFSTWLYRISYRHCLDLLKAAKRRREEALEGLPEPVSPPEPDAMAVESLLEGLSPEYRLVLTLREVQGLSYQEMTAATGDSLDSIKARLRRAREALQAAARHFQAGTGVPTSGGNRQ